MSTLTPQEQTEVRPTRRGVKMHSPIRKEDLLKTRQNLKRTSASSTGELLPQLGDLDEDDLDDSELDPIGEEALRNIKPIEAEEEDEEEKEEMDGMAVLEKSNTNAAKMEEEEEEEQQQHQQVTEQMSVRCPSDRAEPEEQLIEELDTPMPAEEHISGIAEIDEQLTEPTDGTIASGVCSSRVAKIEEQLLQHSKANSGLYKVKEVGVFVLPHLSDDFFPPPPPLFQAPRPILNIEEFPLQPCLTVCPSCEQSIVTETKSEVGSVTKILCLAITMFGGFLGCCLIPFCLKECKDVSHQCPTCQASITTVERF
ncbi:histone H3.v1-like isoform X1 [Polypterus senegalus]|nr:histone H3.v1-like isoform X1 [Polypterus senegalus]